MRLSFSSPAYEIESLKRIGKRICIVRGTRRVLRGLTRVHRNMVVLRHDDVAGHRRELTLINPIRLDKDGEELLLKLGHVTRIIRLAPRQGGEDDAYYLKRFRGVQRFAPKQPSSRPESPFASSSSSSTVRESDLPVHRVISSSDTRDDGNGNGNGNGNDEGTSTILPGCRVFSFRGTADPECAVVLQDDAIDGALLVTANALQAQPPAEQAPSFRPRHSYVDETEPDISIPKRWIRRAAPVGAVSGRNMLRKDFDRLLNLEFEKLIGSSGVLVCKGAKERAVMTVEHDLPVC